MFRYAPGVLKSSGEDDARLVRILDITQLQSGMRPQRQPQCGFDRASILACRDGGYGDIDDTAMRHTV